MLARWFVSEEEAIGWVPVAAFPLTICVFHSRLRAWTFMWSLAATIFFGLKWLSWWKARKKVCHPRWRSVAYLLAWPGMDAETFLNANITEEMPRLRAWFPPIFKTCVGALLLWLAARAIPAAYSLVRGWIGMLALVLLLHFGLFHLAALLWQSLGVCAEPLMSAPWRAKSLGEFWSKRWNRGFRQLGHDLILSPLSGRLHTAPAGFMVFLVSGLVHDLVISVPAHGGYGLPTGYFALQGCGLLLERSRVGRRWGLGAGLLGRFFAVAVAAAPVFWLFHPQFVRQVILPFMEAIHAL